MKYLTILFLLGTINTFARKCSCTEQFEFVRTCFEQNNPAFQEIKADKQLLKEYARAADRLTKKIAAEQGTDLCNIYFNEYVRL